MTAPIEVHESRRQIIKWGTYGKNGDEPLRNVLLKDMSNPHLENVINFILVRLSTYGFDILCDMKNELEYRSLIGIYINDYNYKKIKLFKSHN